MPDKNNSIEDLFDVDGPLAERVPGFEVRNEQVMMARFIENVLLEGQHAIIEAGTGTGKTMAYLLPTLLYAAEYGKKVAVSTETKALQQQLMMKDLPLLSSVYESIIGKELNYALCLGSNNYVCRLRFEGVVRSGRFNPDDTECVEELSDLLKRGASFTRFDVRCGQSLWRDIERDPEGCRGYKCFYHGSCPYQLARRRWQEADLLVMNHYLLFADAASGNALLPVADTVILDEAHSVEEIASRQFGFTVSESLMRDIMGRIHGDPAKKRKGLVHHLASPSLIKELRDRVQALLQKSSKEFERFRPMLDRSSTARILEPPGIDEIFFTDFYSLISLLETLGESFSDNEDILLEYDITMSRLQAVYDTLRLFMTQEDDNMVYWVERRRSGVFDEVLLAGQPVDISAKFANLVTASHESILFVSATLSIQGSTAYYAGRLGLQHYREEVLPSPFRLQDQMFLYLPRFAGDPSEEGYVAHSLELVEGVLDTVGGNCLILFTSYRMLGEFREKLEDKGVQVFSQDQMPAAEALAQFRDSNGGVLMGTHSFWQGIDLPGDLLRSVIIMRLPFPVPDSPVQAARIERIRQAGGNPFMQYQVPQAVLRFRQGFGRLIRGHQDRGIVAVMDRRLWTKQYGSLFLGSLGDIPVVREEEAMRSRYQLLQADEKNGVH